MKYLAFLALALASSPTSFAGVYADRTQAYQHAQQSRAQASSQERMEAAIQTSNQKVLRKIDAFSRQRATNIECITMGHLDARDYRDEGSTTHTIFGVGPDGPGEDTITWSPVESTLSWNTPAGLPVTVHDNDETINGVHRSPSILSCEFEVSTLACHVVVGTVTCVNPDGSPARGARR